MSKLKDKEIKKAKSKLFLLVLIIIILVAIAIQGLLDNMMQIVVKEKKNIVTTDANAGIIVCDSIVQGIRDNNLVNGEYTLRVTGKYGATTQTIDYPIELINFYDDVVYTTNQLLGDTSTTRKMLVVKYHKNLTVNSGVTVTATAVNTYCYKKGMYVCVMGDLVNNGIISMTARGTFGQAGENVYLWKNTNDTYEYIPASGGTGGTAGYYLSPGKSATHAMINGVYGGNGANRQTGGGGAGALTLYRGTYASAEGRSGAGSAGTSYSGGSGGGGLDMNYSGYCYAIAAGGNGGAGGDANAYRGSTSYAVRYSGGGAGTGYGTGKYTSTGNTTGVSDSRYRGEIGTGGLLIVYSNTLDNKGTISSDGSKGGGGRAGGGSSGGGSVNIFANYIKSTGTSTASGGSITGENATDAYARGGAGGSGSITTISLLPEVRTKLKEIVLDVNQEYTFDKNNIEIINQNEIQTGLISLDNIQLDIIDTTIATIDSAGKIRGIKEGKTKVRITEPVTNYITYIFLVVKSGTIPDISAGDEFTVALKKDGTVWSFGRNNYGQLGNGTVQNSSKPVKVENINNIEKISAGKYHGLCLNKDGEVFSWGYNNYGQLGYGNNTSSTIPLKIEGLTNIIKIDAFENRSLALNSAGEAFIWGEKYTNIPTKISVSDKIIDISNDIILTENSKIIDFKWSTNNKTNMKDIAKISAGRGFYLALTVYGEVYSWGINTYGQLGKGINSSSDGTKIVAYNMIDVAAGRASTIMLSEGGNVFVCGLNDDGGIGLGTTVSTSTLTQIGNVSNIEAISTGISYYSILMDSNGYLWGTGSSNYRPYIIPSTNTFTQVQQLQIESDIENQILELGESRDINISIDNIFNLKNIVYDYTENDFIVTTEDISKLYIEGNRISALAEGTSNILITHIPSGTTKQVPVEVVDTTTGFEISTMPKISYKYGEPLDLRGGKLTVTKGAGDVIVDIIPQMVSGYDPNILGPQTLTVSLSDFTQTYEVTVSDFVTGITVAPPTKTQYLYGNNLDLAGSSLVENFASGAVGEEIILDSGMVSGFDSNTIGAQIITVKHSTTNTIDDTMKEFTDTFNISLEDYVVNTDIAVPSKLTYIHGEIIDLTGGTILETMASGLVNNITMTAEMITESDDSPVEMSPGSYDVTNKLDKTLKITYGGTNQNYPITIINDVKSISLTSTPKTEYNVNDILDVTGGEILITRAVGTSLETLTVGMISDFDSSAEGTNMPLTINYTENGITKNTTYNINITDDIIGFTITNLPKTNYKHGETLDVIGGMLTIQRGSGDSQISLTSEMVSGYSSNTLGEQTLTVTYNGFTKNYEVTVSDFVTGIIVSHPTKIEYKYNEDLDLIDGLITTVMASGDVGSSIAITSGMVTGYNKTIIGNQTVTVTYTTTNTIDDSSIDFTENYNVSVEDYVVGINVTPPTKVVYKYGESLDLTGSSLVENYASGAVGTEVTVTFGMVSGYNPNTLGTQTLTVKHTTTNTIDDLSADFTDTFDVTVEDYVANIAITAPTKSVYNHGESLDLTGGTIVETMASGAVNNITMTAGMITETDDSLVVMNPGSYDGSNKLDKILKIKYGGTTQNYHITIINDVKSIVVTSSPKTDYNVNDLLDVTGGQITITRAVGTSVEVLTSEMVTGFDSSVEGNNIPLTVTYTENGITQNTTYNINIVDFIIGFTISNSPKISYNYGEVLDVTGGKMTVTRGSGDTIIDLTSGMVSGYNSNILGTQTLTVTYGGFTQNYDIVVYDYVSDIILNQPNKTVYKYNEELDLLGGEIIPIMASGINLDSVPLTIDMISGYDKTLIGTQIISITYNGIIKQLNIIVENNLESIVMLSNPTKTLYKYGEQIDLAGSKITITNSDGTTEIVDILNSMVTGYSETTLGTQQITVSYTVNGITKTTIFAVVVEDYLQDIQISDFKTSYIINEDLNLDSSRIIPIMASGATVTQVVITQDMITGFDTSVEGAKELTITYNGITKNISIVVNDPIKGIIIQPPIKVQYLYGEPLELSGSTVMGIKTSGATTEPENITSEMVKGYNPNTIGNQTITVSYLEQTITFNVNVTDWDKELRIVSMPKTNYEYGESLDVENGKVAIYTASGVISDTMQDGQPVDMTAGMVSGFNPLKEGIQQPLIVTWNGFRATYNINLVNLITDISIYSRPDSLNFKYGEELNLTGFTIKIKKATGDYILEVSPSMISGYDKNILGEQTITVSYGGKKVDFVINVKENIEEGIEEDPLENDNETNNPIIPNEGDTEAGVIENNQDIEQIIEPDEIIIPDEVKPDNDEGDLDGKPSITLGEQANTGNTKEKIILILMIGTGLFISTILIFGLKRRNIEKK